MQNAATSTHLWCYLHFIVLHVNDRFIERKLRSCPKGARSIFSGQASATYFSEVEKLINRFRRLIKFSFNFLHLHSKKIRGNSTRRLFESERVEFFYSEILSRIFQWMTNFYWNWEKKFIKIEYIINFSFLNFQNISL